MILAVVETWSTQSGWIKFTEHKPSVWGFQTKHRPESRTKLKATAQAARTKGWWYILVWPTNINSEQKRAGNLEMIVFFSGKIHRYFHGGWTISPELSKSTPSWGFERLISQSSGNMTWSKLAGQSTTWEADWYPQFRGSGVMLAQE